MNIGLILFAIFILCAILIALYFLNKTNSTLAPTLAPTLTPRKLVSSIVIKSTGHLIAINEIEIFDNTNKNIANTTILNSSSSWNETEFPIKNLTDNNFSDSFISKPDATLTFTLPSPSDISKIRITNRDVAMDELSFCKMTIIFSDNSTKDYQLTNAKTQEYTY